MWGIANFEIVTDSLTDEPQLSDELRHELIRLWVALTLDPKQPVGFEAGRLRFDPAHEEFLVLFATDWYITYSLEDPERADDEGSIVIKAFGRLPKSL